jgi:hypothetical protein
MQERQSKPGDRGVNPGKVLTVLPERGQFDIGRLVLLNGAEP